MIPSIRHNDNRGYFAETYSHRKYLELGIDVEFVQDNHSLSREVGTLRGLHYQAPPHAQAKLVRCGRGALFDVAVDIRQGSPTYGQWEGYELTAKKGDQLYIPVGFAHGFVGLKKENIIYYFCTNYRSAPHEKGISWNDKDLKIKWPVKKPIVSKKDKKNMSFKDYLQKFIK